MLKFSFPINVNQPKATNEIPYGFIERPENGEEEPGQQWLNVTGTLENGHLYGVTLLNDGKYSFDVKENDLRLTVVRSPIYADHFGERDEFCEYMDQGIQEFKYAIIPQSDNWNQSDIVKKAYELNVPAVHVIETYHRGSLGQKFEGIRISSENVICTVFKQSEDGDGYILRCYETSGNETTVTIEIPMLNRTWDTTLGKCEVKTFRIPLNEFSPIIENNLLELKDRS